MFDLEDHWVWDFWTCEDDDGRVHLFYLHAPRSLGHPDHRHYGASVGHAVSTDLITWQHLPVALRPQPEPAFDDLATWTGCTVRGEDRWWLFTSGVTRAERSFGQRIGSAWSHDLVTWTRTDLVLEPDPRFYDVDHAVGEPHWRDPFVLRDADGLWHMLITARAGGQRRGCGVVGHATSPDLRTWKIGPPLSAPGTRFDQAEVISLVEVEGRWVLVFSCLGPEILGDGAADGGIWTVAAGPPGQPVDLGAAVRLTDQSLYVGQVLTTAHGDPVLLAFRNEGSDGAFVGGIIDPAPVRWRDDGRGLELVADHGDVARP